MFCVLTVAGLLTSTCGKPKIEGKFSARTEAKIKLAVDGQHPQNVRLGNFATAHSQEIVGQNDLVLNFVFMFYAL